MKILNYTPHDINLYGEDKKFIESFPSCGNARVQVSQVACRNVNGYEVYKSKYGEVEGLPEIEYDTVLIVSFMVKQASDRPDLICPNTSPQGCLRDQDGKIFGVTSFQV